MQGQGKMPHALSRCGEGSQMGGEMGWFWDSFSFLGEGMGFGGEESLTILYMCDSTFSGEILL